MASAPSMKLRAGKLNIDLIEKLKDIPGETPLMVLRNITAGSDKLFYCKTVLSGFNNIHILSKWNAYILNGSKNKLNTKKFRNAQEITNIGEMLTTQTALSTNADLEIAKNVIP